MARSSSRLDDDPRGAGAARGLGTFVCVAFTLISLCAVPSAAQTELDVNTLVAAADRAFEQRDLEADGIWAQTEPIATAVAAYRKALEQQPNNLTVRTKLLHAIFFEGEYHLRERGERKRAFDEGCRIFEEGLEQLSRDAGRDLFKVRSDELPQLLKDRPEAGPFFFWGALHWGLWGQYFGKMAGLRQGVAKKIRILGEAAIALDPEFENGGGYRLVGRLHALAPRVPLVTGWVDRKRGVALLERAYEVAPQDPLNALFLGQVLLEFRRERRAEAEQLIRQAAGSSPRPGMRLEDTKAIDEARAAAAAL